MNRQETIDHLIVDHNVAPWLIYDPPKDQHRRLHEAYGADHDHDHDHDGVST